MIIVRRLWEGERAAVRTFYLGLSREDRRLRFFSALNDSAIEAYVDQLAFTHGVVLGAFDVEARLLGTLELSQRSAQGDIELALAVAGDARGKGVGRALVERAWAETRTSPARQLVLVCLSENSAMRRLAQRLGMKLRLVDGDIEALRPVPDASGPEVVQQIAIDLLSTGAWSAARSYGVALELGEQWQALRTEGHLLQQQAANTADSPAGITGQPVPAVPARRVA